MIRLGHLSDAKRKALVIADNQLALNAGWDEAALSVLIQELDAEKFELDLLGFAADDLDRYLTGLDGQMHRLLRRLNFPRSRSSQLHSPATFGFLGRIGCCVATPRW